MSQIRVFFNFMTLVLSPPSEEDLTIICRIHLEAEDEERLFQAWDDSYFWRQKVGFDRKSSKEIIEHYSSLQSRFGPDLVSYIELT